MQKKRFLDSLRPLLPAIIIVSMIRVACAMLLYLSLTSFGSSGLAVPFMSVIKVDGRLDWLYLYSNWDTGHFVGIAINWYPKALSAEWAFFPLYPTAIRLVSLLGIHPLLAAFVIATCCGIASVALFQKVAEKYLPNSRRLITTVLYFLFPPVLVFSSVSYTESMFLVFCLLTWILHKKGMNGRASLSACLCALTRSYGILIILPILFDHLLAKQFRALRYATLPIAALVGWLGYGYLMTGDFLVSLTVRRYWTDQNALVIRNALLKLLTGDLSGLSTLSRYTQLGVEGIIYLAVIVFLAYRSIKLDRALGLYGFASIFSIVYFGFVTSYLSLPRYVSFIFPLGLSMYSRNRLLIAVVVALFLLIDLIGWRAFIVDTFT